MTIQEYRLKHHLTHSQMAKLLNISESYYYSILSGKRKVSKKLIMHIKNNLKEIDYEFFLQ